MKRYETFLDKHCGQPFANIEEDANGGLVMYEEAQAEIDRLKAENAELLAENKQLKHLADPAREVDIQAVCADVIDRQINHHGYTNTDYCHFCGVRLCYGEAHRHDCSVLIAMDLTNAAIAKAQGGS